MQRRLHAGGVALPNYSVPIISLSKNDKSGRFTYILMKMKSLNSMFVLVSDSVQQKLVLGFVLQHK